MRIAKPSAGAVPTPCPFCLRLVIFDEANAIVHHEAPACARWIAKMSELKLDQRVSLIDEADIPKGKN